VIRLRVDTIEHIWLRAFELLVSLSVLVRELDGELKVATPNAPVCTDLASTDGEHTPHWPGIGQLKADS
jgi:hypothetical protein